MKLAAAALLLTAVALQAQTPTEAATRVVLDASRALQAGSAPRFLGYFDRKQTDDFPALRDGVTALLVDSKVASSVEVRPIAERPREIDFEIDWILQISSERDLGQVDERRRMVKATVRVSDGDKAKLIRVEPLSFFSPQSIAP